MARKLDIYNDDDVQYVMDNYGDRAWRSDQEPDLGTPDAFGFEQGQTVEWYDSKFEFDGRMTGIVIHASYNGDKIIVVPNGKAYRSFIAGNDNCLDNMVEVGYEEATVIKSSAIFFDR